MNPSIPHFNAPYGGELQLYFDHAARGIVLAPLFAIVLFGLTAILSLKLSLRLQVVYSVSGQAISEQQARTSTPVLTKKTTGTYYFAVL